MPAEALETWTVGHILDPVNDLLGELKSTLAMEPEKDRRQGDRRKDDRRRAATEVRVTPTD